MIGSLGKLFVAALCNEKHAADALSYGKIDDMFNPMELPAYEFMRGFLMQYGALPTPATIAKHVGEEMPQADEPASYYFDLLQLRHTERELKRGMKDASALLGTTGKDPMGALEKLRDAVAGVIGKQQGKDITDFRQAYDLIMPDIASKFSGDDGEGVLMGWPTIDEMTGGLRRGNKVSFVGKIALGKTMQMLYCCHHGWQKQGLCQLFVSNEMPALEIHQRLIGVEAHVPAKKITDADLSTLYMTKLKASLTEIKGAKSPLWVVDANFTATVEGIAILARQLKPDSIWIDGAYLLKHPTERDRYKRVAENADLIKQELSKLAPTICSWQFAKDEKGAKKKKKKTLDDVGYAYAIGQVSSLVLGLFEDESAETTKSRVIEILKGRKGEIGEFRTRWDWTNMDFSEVIEESVESLNFV